MNVTEVSNIQFQTVQTTPHHPLTLPDNFKQTLSLDEGGSFTAIHLNEMVLLVAKPIRSLEILDNMGNTLQQANLSLNDLLSNLADIRTDMLQERYGITP